MRVCPQCSRKNKPQAKFCDQCGLELVGSEEAEPLPPGDTAKGLAPAQAGIPAQLRSARGAYRQTQKIDAPPLASGTPTDRDSHNQQTVKVARMPAPAREASGPLTPIAKAPASPPVGDPEPEATIQGAFYLRKQEAGRAASTEAHVGWLVETSGAAPTGGVWPVTAGPTFIGSNPEEVGSGVVVDRPALAPLHALLFHRRGQTWLVDLATPGGTLLNGERLPPLIGRLLGERDELRLGELCLSFRGADPRSNP